MFINLKGKNPTKQKQTENPKNKKTPPKPKKTTNKPTNKPYHIQKPGVKVEFA